MTFFKKCRMRVNASEWRGHAPGTVILAQGTCTPSRKAKLTFFVRNEGYDIHAGGATFQAFGKVDFKYALRALHRKGYRNVQIRCKPAGSQSRWLNQDGIPVATP